MPVNLADGKRIRIGVLKANSPCAGQSLKADCFGGKDDVEFILVLRGDRALWPHSDLKLEPRDRLIAVASDSGWSRIDGQFDRVAPPDGGSTHESHTPDRGTPP